MCETERETSNFELIGLAQAKIEVRAFRVVIIPALATEIVCCSYGNINLSKVMFKKIRASKKTHHNLVKNRASIIGHFVKLINTTNTTITQNKCTTYFVSQILVNH